MHSFSHITFNDNMTVVDLIVKNDESAYRELMQWLMAWRRVNNLSLNINKTKEMGVDFWRAILIVFYRGTADSILSSCITAWFGNCTSLNHNTPQWIKACAYLTSTTPSGVRILDNKP
ncbi:hypothetical protein QTP70_013137 [Hemibagrus guttatus]|uniref:Uncharacterized protein n=1 Tax=Hemibagrus guttatus TaxID=175788 RepID=A0AAE0V893_9TELE|nr:hypothetical protein QTP70_013137 [Hemibagrus guttatus]